MTDTARMRKYAEWLVANKDKSGTAQFQTVANAYKQLRSAPAQQTAQPNQSFVGALQYGLDAPLENIATTAKAVGMEGVGNFLSNLTDAPQNYASASEEFINQGGDGYKLTALPRAVVEQGAQFAGSLASRAGGAALGGAVGGLAGGAGAVPGAIAGGLAGPALFEAIQVLGPVAMERAKNNGRDKPNASDWQGAIATASASGALNAMAPGFQGLVKRIGVEAATEGLQSVVQQTGETALTEAGLEISPKQAIGEGIIGGGAAGGVTGVTQTLTKVTETGERIFRPQEELSERQKQGMASFANRLLRIAEREGLDLENVDTRSDKGAKQALTFGEGEVRNEIDTVMDQLKDKKVREELGMDDAEYRRIKTGVYQAKGKQRDIVPEETIDFVTGRFGDTQIGQELANAFIESNSATQLNREGTIGGFSQFVNGFLPWSRTASPITTISRAAAPAIGLATGGATGLVTAVAAPLAVVGVANTIDKITGRKSKIARFTRKNKGNETLPTPDGRDVVAEVKARQEAERLAKEQAKQAREEEAARRKKLAEDARIAREAEQKRKKEADEENERQKARNNVAGVQNGDAPVAGSPRAKAFDALMERAGNGPLSRILKEAYNDGRLTPRDIDNIIAMAIAQEVGVNPENNKEPAETYLRMLETGVSPKNNYLNVVLPMIKRGLLKIDGIQDMIPQKETDGKDADAEPRIPVLPRTPQVQQGVDDNRLLLEELGEALDADDSINPADKGVIRVALAELRKSFSGSPERIIQKVKDIEAAAMLDVPDPALVRRFVTPYVERVIDQQQARIDREAQDEGKQGDSGDGGPVGPGPGGSGVLAGRSSGDSGPDDARAGRSNVTPGRGAGASRRDGKKAKAPKGTKSKKPAKAKIEKLTKQQVIDGIATGNATLDVGKKGSPFEFGIPSYDDAIKIAKALGYTLNIYNSGSAFHKAERASRTANAKFTRSHNIEKGFGGVISVVREDGTIGGEKNPDRRFMELLHEFGHGIATANIRDGGVQGVEYVANPILGFKDRMSPHGFEGVLYEELSKPGGTTLLQEIQNLQHQAIKVPQSGALVDVREGLNRFNRPNLTPSSQKYLNKIAELATDMIWPFLMNPKEAQVYAPQTAALLKKTFNEAKATKIRFYEVESVEDLSLSLEQLEKKRGVRKTDIAFGTALGMMIAMALAGIGFGEEEEESQGILAA